MIKSAKENIQAVLDIAEQTKNIELKQEILNLKEVVLELQSENMGLKQELQDKKQKQSYNMEFKGEFYVNKNDDGTEQGKYCSKCWDDEGKAMNLILKKYSSGSEILECLKCKNIIDVCYGDVQLNANPDIDWI